MSLVLPVILPIRGCHPRWIRRSVRFCQAALLWVFCVAPAWATPIIMNTPLTMMPGSVVSVIGSGFGSSPLVNFSTRQNPGTRIQVKIIKGDNNVVAFEVPSNLPFQVYNIAISDGQSWSQTASTNTPQAMQFDKPEIAGGDRFRIFGRNLYVPASVGQPTVSLVDISTGAQLTAPINLNQSDAYSLTLTAPAGIQAGHSYRALVSNGSGSANSDVSILGHAANGIDYFNLGVPWGRDYIYQNGPNYTGLVDNADHHFYDVTSDPFLKLHAKGDGVTDDMPAIQAAINAAAAHGGGIVYLPPGTYKFASNSNTALYMASNVVVRGYANSQVTILMGPATQQPSTYVFWGVYWPPGTTMSGMADLSIKNIDTLSQNVKTIVSGGPTSKLFLQRINWDLGSSQMMSVNNSDRMVISYSTFHQSINYQNPNPVCPMSSGEGPFWFDNLTNFTFTGNTLWWASGGNEFLTINNGVFEGNHFTRSASDKIVVTSANISCLNNDYYENPVKIGDSVQRQLAHVLATEFAQNLVIQNNLFDVTDGVLKFNLVDGETILNEGGAHDGQKQDAGTVMSATSTTLNANSKCSGTCNWNLAASSVFNPGTRIAIVSGQGWGQWRQVISEANNTFTVSPPWDIVPAPGDNFSVFEPTMMNSLIRNNIMNNNPNGILLWASGFLNVSVLNNTLIDNGGIIVQSIQDIQALGSISPKIGSFRNIEINGNTVKNTKSLYPAYIFVNDALDDPNYIWGTGIDSVEVRNNAVTGRTGTPSYYLPDGSYYNQIQYADPRAQYSPNSLAYGIVGTILQGNSCWNCPSSYTLSTGVLDTIIWNSVGPSTVNDKKVWGTATQASTGTVVGHD